MKFKIVSPDNKTVGHIIANEEKDLWILDILKNKPEYPLTLKLLLEQGKNHVEGKLARMFLQERVFPPERQNIATILRDMGLKEYSVVKQIEIMQGRCDRDNFMLIKE